MSSEHPTPLSPTQKCRTDPALLDAAIQEFLGVGLGYCDWPEEIKKRNHVWYPGLEKIIIKKEFEYFKDEIQLFRSEPAIAQSSRAKSNSLKSILKRLKGEPWMDGGENEWEERFWAGRLLSKDAKDRCLIDYVHRWDREAALLASQVSVEAIASSPNSDDTDVQLGGSDSATRVSGLGAPSSAAANQSSYEDTPKPEEPFSPPQDTSVITDELPLICDGSSHLSNANEFPCTLWPTSDDFDLTPNFQQNAIPFPDSETPARYSLPESPPSAIQTIPPAFSHDTAMASFDQFQVGEDFEPADSTSYSHGVDLPDPESNVFKWLEANPVSEESSEVLDTENPRPDSAFQGTFFDPRDRVNMSEFLVAEAVSVPDAESATKTTPVVPVEQKYSQQGGPEALSDSIPSPHPSSHTRKRRRRNTFGMSPDTSEYRNVAADPFTYNVTSDGDTMMVGCESSIPPANKPALPDDWMQSPPPSRALPNIPFTRMHSKPAYIVDDHRVKLEQELQQTKDELDSAAKRHREELDSMSKTYQAQILDLREQLRKLQLTNKRMVKQYEGLTRDLINEKIILQDASARKKSVSDLPPIGTEEREHSTKASHRFPPSKEPRPLSLSLRTVSAVNTPLAAHSNSPTSSDNAPTLNITIPMPNGRSNRSRSSESLVLRPAAMSHGTSPIRSNNAVSSEDQIVTRAPARATGRGNRSGSAGSLAAPNFSDAVRRDTNPKPHWMHKISNPFMRKQFREDSSRSVRPVQPVPALPLLADSVATLKTSAGSASTLTTSAGPVPALPTLDRTVPLNIQMSDVLIDGDKRRTKDSGYDSLRFDTSSRASMVDGE